MARIPPLDPEAPKSLVFRFNEWFAQTRVGRWFAMNVATRLDPILLRLTRGRTGTFVAAKVVMLTVPGRKTGEPRSQPLLYYTEGDDVIVIASSFGRDKHPAWYLNVKAHPEVELAAAGRRGRYVAEEVRDPERKRLYDRAKSLYDGWEDYEHRVDGVRTIPVLRLKPLDAA
jgi:deazaflavin-dependent oxidoreductase (nitroreductase family)